MRFRIAIFDPLPVFRHGVMTILREAGFESEAPDDLLAWARDEQQKLVVLSLISADDWGMLERVHDESPDAVVVAVLPDQGLPLQVRAFRSGASGVLLRDARPGVVREVIVAALNGRCVLPIDVVRSLAEAPNVLDNDRPTATEREWLTQLARGNRVGDIANSAGYSERMMFRLLRDLYTRIGADNRLEAIIRARDAGWII